MDATKKTHEELQAELKLRTDTELAQEIARGAREGIAAGVRSLLSESYRSPRCAHRVQGPLMQHRTPCPTCPWRVGVDAWAIGRTDSTPVPPLHYEEMVRLAANQSGDLFTARLMGCHHHFKNEETIPPHARICVGFALQAGMANVQYRLAVAQGSICPEKFSRDAELHKDFAAMIDANPIPVLLKETRR